MVFGDPVALLTTDTLPLALPDAVGANNTVRVSACEGDRVTGNEPALTENAEPLAVTWVILTFAFPVFVSVTVLELEAPVFTLPKLRLEVLAERVSVVAVPVPDKEIVVGEFGALLTMDKLPLALPAFVGANCTLNVLDCPAPSTSGVVRPVTL